MVGCREKPTGVERRGVGCGLVVLFGGERRCGKGMVVMGSEIGFLFWRWFEVLAVWNWK
jgi:hypothetical protein